jgi:hypothetical protein
MTKNILEQLIGKPYNEHKDNPLHHAPREFFERRLNLGYTLVQYGHGDWVNASLLERYVAGYEIKPKDKAKIVLLFAFHHMNNGITTYEQPKFNVKLNHPHRIPFVQDFRTDGDFQRYAMMFRITLLDQVSLEEVVRNYPTSSRFPNTWSRAVRL